MKTVKMRSFFALFLLIAVTGCGENIDKMQSYGSLTGPGGGLGTVTITVTPTTLPDGTQSASYNQTLTATGGTAPYTWSVISGSLPTGVTLGATTGTLSGTPTGTGTSSFTVQARDSSLNSGSQALSIVVYSVPLITTTAIPAAVQNVLYGEFLTATGGQAPLMWSLVSGSLPSGLTLNSDGTITGTTVAATGNYPLQVIATDAGSRASLAKSLTLIVNSGITISPVTLPAGIAGTAYSQTLTASGGTSDYSCSLTNGALPASLALATVVPDTCTITGTPTVAGTSNFQVTATDFWGATGAQTLSITINLGVSPAALPDADGTTPTPYAQILTAVGATGATTWSLNAASGPLPTGLSLSTGGVFSGTPVLGDVGFTFPIDIDVTDAGTGFSATFSLSITVI